MRVLTSSQMKEAEKRSDALGVTYLRLMENAGSAAYRLVREHLEEGEGCAVICGKGNNGGDGFVVARKLRQDGYAVVVILAQGAPVTQEAEYMYRDVEELGIPVLYPFGGDAEKAAEAISCAGVVVDALYGTGFRGSLRAEQRGLVEQMNRSPATVISLDIPSGVTADTGSVEGLCTLADYTISFASYKPAHFIYPGATYCGQVLAVDIGLPEEAYAGIAVRTHVVDKAWVKESLPVRREDSHKGDYGRLCAICGSRGMTGAATMAALGALRTGVGLCYLTIPDSILTPLSIKLTEAVLKPLPSTETGCISQLGVQQLLGELGRYSCVLLGCGIGITNETRALTRQVLENTTVPLVLDADGLNILSEGIDYIDKVKSQAVLTPHAGEMARLIGKPREYVENNRQQVAREFAVAHDCVVVLKGAHTLVAMPDGNVVINTTGNPGMAKGGSGDLLAGMIASFIAQGLPVPTAAVVGVYLHGLAGDICAKELSQQAMLPSDMAAALPKVFCSL